MMLVERLRTHARCPVDYVLQQSRHRTVVFRRGDYQGVIGLDAAAEFLRASGQTLRIFNILIVGGTVELLHQSVVHNSAVLSNGSNSELRQLLVQRRSAKRSSKD